MRKRKLREATPLPNDGAQAHCAPPASPTSGLGKGLPVSGQKESHPSLTRPRSNLCIVILNSFLWQNVTGCPSKHGHQEDAGAEGGQPGRSSARAALTPPRSEGLVTEQPHFCFRMYPGRAVTETHSKVMWEIQLTDSYQHDWSNQWVTQVYPPCAKDPLQRQAE
ncbi:uncharacterized protein LOC123810585 isoform X2 [Phyllostomus hastatus]|uniref:uncharacterized protein LOC123810585 isoform X2 n=1 Tax=Phyllostomus hastatus TaxID=9423 RepID=UPI001E683A8D|nr:uncharacterized protein LOC123810585 isoform X2 [Phyllostomus hastatus]